MASTFTQQLFDFDLYLILKNISHIPNSKEVSCCSLSTSDFFNIHRSSAADTEQPQQVKYVCEPTDDTKEGKPNIIITTFK